MYGDEHARMLGVRPQARADAASACQQARAILGWGNDVSCEQLHQKICNEDCGLFRGDWNGRDTVRMELCGTSRCHANDNISAAQSDACWTARWALGQHEPSWYVHSCERIIQHVCTEDCSLFSGGGDPTRAALCGSNTCPTTPPGPTPEYGLRWVSHNTPQAMAAGSFYDVAVVVTNIGNMTWRWGGSNPVHLGAHLFRGSNNPGNIIEPFYRHGAGLSADVPPGATASFVIRLQAPAEAGQYTWRYDLVHEGVTWFMDKSQTPLDVVANVAVTAPPPPPACTCWNGAACPGGLVANCPPIGAPPCKCADGRDCPGGIASNCVAVPPCKCADGSPCPGGMSANCPTGDPIPPDDVPPGAVNGAMVLVAIAAGAAVVGLLAGSRGKTLVRVR